MSTSGMPGDNMTALILDLRVAGNRGLTIFIGYGILSAE